MDFNKLSQLGYFSSTVRLGEAILAQWTSIGMGVRVRLREVSAHGRLKCRVSVEKLPGTQYCVRLWEMSVCGGSTVVTKLPTVNRPTHRPSEAKIWAARLSLGVGRKI